MSGLPVKYRVRLAFGFYRVGHVFMSPPMGRAYADQLKARGFIEVVEDIEVPEQKKRGRPKKYQ